MNDLDNYTLELLNEWIESMAIVELKYQSASMSLNNHMKLNQKLWDRCNDLNINMNELIQSHGKDSESNLGTPKALKINTM